MLQTLDTLERELGLMPDPLGLPDGSVPLTDGDGL